MLERSQRQFVTMCQNRFFTYDHVNYEEFMKIGNLPTLHNSMYTPGALFFLFLYISV